MNTELETLKQEALSLVKELETTKIVDVEGFLEFTKRLNISQKDTDTWGSGDDIIGYTYTKNILKKKLYYAMEANICFDDTLQLTLSVREWTDYEEFEDVVLLEVEREFQLNKDEVIKFLKEWGETLKYYVKYKGELKSTIVIGTRLPMNLEDMQHYVHVDGENILIDFTNPDFEEVI